MKATTLLFSQSVFFVSNVFVGHISDDPINLEAAGKTKNIYYVYNLALSSQWLAGLGFTVSCWGVLSVSSTTLSMTLCSL